MSATESKPITTRAELMERLRTSSRQEVVLEEMQRLGFWPSGTGQPSELEQLVQREAELSSALLKLGQELRTVQDPEAALKAMRKERLTKARARREETRQRRARERFERATAWHQRRSTELLYLGEGVSAGLNQAEGDAEKLARWSLPALHNAQELASAMGVTLPELRFLSFERRVSRISHYRRFAMPKKSGGERIISAPMPRVKRLQYWVLDNILAKVPLHPAAHGFVPGRSIVSNAQPHVGKAVVVNLDLKNFFPSIGLPRIKGIFRELGYSEQLATTLGLLCTETPSEEVSVDGEKFFVATGERALPQGAPSSPALTNILCRRLDARVQSCAAKLGFTYTRYADDLTFSGDAAARKLAGKLLWRVKQIIADEGFTPHPEKQHVMGAGHCQSVTGIVVNQKLSLERETLRRFRATLFQVEKDGPAGKQWNGNANVIDALEGYAQFIRMVDAEKGAPLLQRVRAARARWIAQAQDGGEQAARRSSGFRALSAQGKEPWAGFWQAQAPAAPELEKTQQQVKQEKLEHRQAQKAKPASGRPAVAAGAGPSARATRRQAPEAPPAEQEEPYKFSDRPWLGILIQLYLAFSLCRLYHTPLPLVFAVMLAIPAWRNYRAYWLRYFSYMCLAVLLGIVLRKLL
ncbi:RNA-directed DNA polymerase [Pseudoduganella sp. DS3]|uniref:RNA-directed DNA polymerase n=1 Tax=Pseudoduganella guangdongensis TaxID=2692179 RepID=A0A6N9HPY6_9BURK|nr:reverse transcriptase family protein [Pseudoduganella guangdongensis]MYN05590.1 RNA-directed DNA polymerase [Pseudoduganella guangdongensis]